MAETFGTFAAGVGLAVRVAQFIAQFLGVKGETAISIQ